MIVGSAKGFGKAGKDKGKGATAATGASARVQQLHLRRSLKRSMAQSPPRVTRPAAAPRVTPPRVMRPRGPSSTPPRDTRPAVAPRHIASPRAKRTLPRSPPPPPPLHWLKFGEARGGQEEECKVEEKEDKYVEKGDEEGKVEEKEGTCGTTIEEGKYVEKGHEEDGKKLEEGKVEEKLREGKVDEKGDEEGGKKLEQAQSQSAAGC